MRSRPSRRSTIPPRSESRQEVLLRQARRHRRRGELRRAMVLLREACALQSRDARLWTLYGVACLKLGRREDACKALGQAAWLRNRERDHSRERVVRRLIEQVQQGSEGYRLPA